MALNKLRQSQIKANAAMPEGFSTLEQQLRFVEDRTRAIAKLTYESKTQWDTGTKLHIDSDTYLDQIQLAKDGDIFYTSGTYTSYVLDYAASNVKFASLDYTQNKPVGTTVTYYTRSGDYQSPDETWSAWQTITIDNKIQSPNARYLQFKIELATSNTSISPRVTAASAGAYASAGTQEIFNARGAYQTIDDRISAMGSIFHLKVIPQEGQTDINLNKIIPDAMLIKVYLNGQLQSEGTNDEDSYTLVNSQIIRFNFQLTADDLVIIRVEGTGSGVVTIKENRIVGEIPTTSDRITYTLQRTPIPTKEEVMVEGIRLTPGAENDYTVTGNQIVFNYTINISFTVRVNYLYY